MYVCMYVMTYMYMYVIIVFTYTCVYTLYHIAIAIAIAGVLLLLVCCVLLLLLLSLGPPAERLGVGRPPRGLGGAARRGAWGEAVRTALRHRCRRRGDRRVGIDWGGDTSG